MANTMLRLLTITLLANLILAQGNQTTCSPGVHMIVARASTEQPGTGIIGAVAQNVSQQIPGSSIVAVDYPATLENYQASEAQGVTAMTKLVQDYAAACPTSKMVLMGYSQGAQVALDVLCGTSEKNFTPTKPVADVLGNRTSNSRSHPIGKNLEGETGKDELTRL
jgi:hypothetical protein